MKLSSRVAVVTGASKGIGLAVTRALAGEGVRVVAGARTVSPGLAELGDAVVPFAVDLSTPDGPARLVDAAVEEFGVLDILVNNVGAVRPRPGGFLSVTGEDWATALTINLLAAVRTTRAGGGAADAIAKQAAGDSVTGRFTQPGEVADLVLMLAGGRAADVTGADFVIDGGLVTTL